MHNYEIIIMFKVHEDNLEDKLNLITTEMNKTFEVVEEIYRKNHNLVYYIQNEKEAKYVIYKGISENVINNSLSLFLSGLVKKGYILRSLILKVKNYNYITNIIHNEKLNSKAKKLHTPKILNVEDNISLDNEDDYDNEIELDNQEEIE